MYKYTLIISQFYYSRHFFIVKHDENFIENAKKFALELVAHKRCFETGRELYIGDLEIESKEIRQRYNINDQGDIYFLQSNYANGLMGDSWGYKEDTRRESRGFQKKADVERINKHHNYKDVKKIVEKHFEIA
jgi:hypothetical protein